jgi:2,4-dienoyl-CoA reductase (NADPH2)
MTKYPHLLSPIAFGRKQLMLANRVIMNPMAMNFERECSLWSKEHFQRMKDFYGLRAQHYVPLIIVGGISPSKIGTFQSKAPFLASKDVAKELLGVTDAVHHHGGKIVLQAFHAGRFALKDLRISASTEWTKVHSLRRLPVLQLPSAFINYVVSEYERFAFLAEMAGFDGIEIPLSDGSLLHNFLSRACNFRSDRFGGSLENRYEIVRRVLATVKNSLQRPDNFSVIVRLTMHDLHPDGNTMEENLRIGELVSRSGVVDVLTTSVGMHDSPVPTTASYVPRATFSRGAKLLKSHLQSLELDIPVAASHRINTAEVADALLRDRVCDLVCVGRPLLADPLFLRKITDGVPEAVVPCIACNHCFNAVHRSLAVRCAVNPWDFGAERPAEQCTIQKTVAVVGAGAAGITCALTLWERGHKVVLFEQESTVGGQLNLAMMIPGKEEYVELIKYWTQRLRDSSITVKLNTKFREEDVTKLQQQFDAVVLTVGSQPTSVTSHKIPGMSESEIVVPFRKILDRSVVAGRRVAILGGGAIAHDVASFLVHDHRACRSPDAFLEQWGVNFETGTTSLQAAKQQPRNGRDVMLFQKWDRHADLNKSKGWTQKLWLRNHRATVLVNAMPEQISGRKLVFTLQGMKMNDVMHMECDTIIHAMGMMNNASLGVYIRDHVTKEGIERGAYKRDFSIFVAGSCRDAHTGEGNGDQSLTTVIREGYEIGITI